jgi:hypothetical protein
VKTEGIHPVSRWLLLAGFGLLIVGAKLWFIDCAGSDLPTWDQWDAESAGLLQPWLEGRMSAPVILAPHNEHRLVTTNLYSLGLFVLNGQWDGFLETTVNAVIHAASALLLLWLARRWLSRAWIVPFAALLVLLFTLPFSWENALFGFQVQFYFLLLFSIGHLWLSLGDDRFSVRWGLGQVCGALAVGSMASGFLSAAAILAVLGYRLLRERRWSQQQVTTASLAVIFCIAGWFMKYEVPGHAVLHAHGPREFCEAFLQLLAWPGSVLFPWSLLLLAPAAVFLARRLRSRTISPDDALLLGLLGWILLQCLATAYARGGSESVLSSRYFDLLAVHVALGLVFVLREFSGRTRSILVSLWLAAMVAGLVQQSFMMWRNDIAENIPRQQRQEGHVRDFLRTGDSAHLLNKPWGDVPYPDGAVLVERLTPPVIQAIMPPSVRRSVPVSNGAPTAVPADVPAAMRPIALSTWSVAPRSTPFHWRSALQPATTLPILRFRVAGDLGDPDRHGQLVVKSAAGEVAVLPESAPGAYWKNVSVFRPAGEWWLEATAPEAGSWFAFTEPVEVGRWTWGAEKLLKHHFAVLFLGVAFLAVGAWPLRRRNPL